jgi:hypothetical protein
MSGVTVFIEKIDDKTVSGNGLSGLITINGHAKNFSNLTVKNGVIENLGEIKFEEVADTDSGSVELPKVDCSKALENRGDGSCAFDSFAQIYQPYDYKTEKENFNNLVVPISNTLRSLVVRAYTKALTDETFKTTYIIKNKYTDILVPNPEDASKKIPTEFTLDEYKNYITGEKAWGGDDEIILLQKLLEIGDVEIVGPDNVSMVTDIKIGSAAANKYTFCNKNAGHWRLLQTDKFAPRTWAVDKAKAEEKLNSSPSSGGGKKSRRRHSAMRKKTNKYKRRGK